jgi:hypothetical protein
MTTRHIADKAKPRAIVGRKATGPSGIAGLPKEAKEFLQSPWFLLITGFFMLK